MLLRRCAALALGAAVGAAFALEAAVGAAAGCVHRLHGGMLEGGFAPRSPGCWLCALYDLVASRRALDLVLDSVAPDHVRSGAEQCRFGTPARMLELRAAASMMCSQEGYWVAAGRLLEGC